MIFTLHTEAIAFLYSIAMGAVLCVLFDMFCVMRMFVRPTILSAFWQDIVFWLVAAVLTYCFLLVHCYGIIRGYVLFGELLGFLLCRFTLSAVFIAMMSQVVRAVKSVVAFLRARIFRPVSKKIRIFVRLTVQKALVLQKTKNNLMKNAKKHLNFRRKTAYNNE